MPIVCAVDERQQSIVPSVHSIQSTVFGISFGHILLKEEFSGMTYAACGLVFIGLIVNQWKTKSDLPLPQEGESIFEPQQKVA